MENGVVGLQEMPERLLLRGRCAAETLVQIACQQLVELPHAAAAAPPQFPELLSIGRGRAATGSAQTGS